MYTEWIQNSVHSRHSYLQFPDFYSKGYIDISATILPSVLQYLLLQDYKHPANKTFCLRVNKTVLM